MKERLFKFKQFSTWHQESAMKIGVDGVLLGAWATGHPAHVYKKILDVGCGCGVISLMLAQLNPLAQIHGIDIHYPSVCETNKNFAASNWSGRLSACCINWLNLCDISETLGNKYDLIVSNPPFFNAGIDPGVNDRLKARHTDSLSPLSLISNSPKLLNTNGRLCIIVPVEQADEIIRAADNCLFLSRMTIVRGNYHTTPKRALMEFSTKESIPLIDTITLEYGPGHPTLEYRLLARMFYLYF